jgi:hypothetical protein
MHGVQQIDERPRPEGAGAACDTDTGTDRTGAQGWEEADQKVVASTHVL